MTLSTPKLGLLGCNISYSLSPHIHQFSAKLLGKSDQYSLYDIPEADVENFLTWFSEEGGLGLNITTPYKNTVAKITGSRLSSVNTIRADGPKRWLTTSTDGTGFLRSFEFLKTDIRSYSNLVILGSGGVTDSLLSLFNDNEHLLNIHILRRNNKRDHELRSLVSTDKSLAFHPFSPEFLDEVLRNGQGESLLIQATSAPSHGDDLSQFIPALTHFNGAFVDLIYKNPSSLLKHCLKRGIPACDGLPMLIGQALASQQFWWGQSAPFETVYEHMASVMQA